MNDSKTTDERLRELLDAKDAEVERLETELREAKAMLESDPFAWAVGGEVPERGLPVPRLEIEWIPDDEWGWQKSIASYRIVYRHLRGHAVGVGIGRTTVNSSRKDPPINPRGIGHRPGKVELPFRDGAHICHDMAELNLPGFAICGEQIDDLGELRGKPGER